jgi:hypothetical protein
MKRFQECKYGFVALSISVGEAIIISSGLGIIYATGLWGQAPPWVRHFYQLASLAVPLDLIVAILGLIRDSWRLYAALALLLTLVDAAAYGLLIAV